MCRDGLCLDNGVCGMMVTRKSSHTGRLDSLGGLCVRVLLKRHMCIEQLEPDDDDMCSKQG